MTRLFRLIVLVCATLVPTVVFAAPPSIAVIGGETLVFDWSTQRCEDFDFPDLPARAFRDVDGLVHLVSTTYINRQAVGRTLNTVVHECPVVLNSTENPAPSAYAGFEWLAALYTTDGETVHALVHNEFQGNVFGLCASGSYLSCWYNAITGYLSTDRGQTYGRTGLVASVPYPYVPDAGPYGYFMPSNIVLKNGYYYALFQAEPYGAQRVGTCAMRTTTLEDPASWRFWTGRDWTGEFANPYEGASNPSSHVCTPVSFNRLEKMHESLTWNTYWQKWLLIGSAGNWVNGVPRYGFYFSLSDNLTTWSNRTLFYEAPIWNWTCGDPDPLSYPTALDPASTDRNFGTTGSNFDLYFVRQHMADNCAGTLDRDLIRVPVRVSGSIGRIR